MLQMTCDSPQLCYFVNTPRNGLLTPPTRRDKTVLSGLQLCSQRQNSCVSSRPSFDEYRPSFDESTLAVWTQYWRRDNTVLSCRVGGVNTTADKTRQFCPRRRCEQAISHSIIAERNETSHSHRALKAAEWVLEQTAADPTWMTELFRQPTSRR